MTAAHKSAISVGLLYIPVGLIPKEHGITSLILAKYDAEGQLGIETHVTLGVNRQKMWQAGVEEEKCPFSQVPVGHEDAVWLRPMVCTIEYMPSERDGYRQTVFKGFRDDKLPDEC